jgi:hypothetical protein
MNWERRLGERNRSVDWECGSGAQVGQESVAGAVCKSVAHVMHDLQVQVAGVCGSYECTGFFRYAEMINMWFTRHCKQ